MIRFIQLCGGGGGGRFGGLGVLSSPCVLGIPSTEDGLLSPSS